MSVLTLAVVGAFMFLLCFLTFLVTVWVSVRSQEKQEQQ